KTLCTHLQRWADRLSGVIEEVVVQQAELLAAYSAPNPSHRAEERMRDILEDRIGHKLEPKTPPEESGKWVPLDPKSIGEWLIDGEKPSGTMVWWVAEVAAGEGDDLLQAIYDEDRKAVLDSSDEIDVDETLAEQWEGPAWLKGDLALPNESPE